MDDRAATIQEYFTKLRHEPAITTAELRAMLDHPAPQAPARHWRQGKVGTVLGLAVLATAILVLAGHDSGPPKRKGRSHATPARSAAAGERAHTRAAAPAGASHPGIAPAPTPARTATGTLNYADSTPGHVLSAPVGSPVMIDVSKKSNQAIYPAAEVKMGMRIRPAHVLIDPLYQSSSEVLIKPSSSGSKPVLEAINSVRMISLSDSELANLGVRVRPDGIMMLYTMLSAANGSRDPVYRACVIDPKETHVMAIAASEVPVGIQAGDFPRLITRTDGSSRPFHQRSSTVQPADSTQILPDSLTARELSIPCRAYTLVPVLVRLEDRVLDATNQNTEQPRDIVLWYRPTARLLGGLPACLRNELQGELTAAAWALKNEPAESRERFQQGLAPRFRVMFDSLHALNTAMSTPCRHIYPDSASGEPVLDIWRSAAGAILSSSVPLDPAYDAIHIHYRLGARRPISINLYNLGGMPQRNLSKIEWKDPGEWNAACPVKYMPPGIYLVVISTGRDEWAVQRVIVE